MGALLLFLGTTCACLGWTFTGAGVATTFLCSEKQKPAGAVLDVLANNPKMCQRDLAKIILKDRANTGKLLDSLEKRGYVTRTLSIKNNRPVKIVEITDKGVKKAEEVLEKIRPHFQRVMEKINNSDVGRVSDLLKELREILDETLEIQI